MSKSANKNRQYSFVQLTIAAATGLVSAMVAGIPGNDGGYAGAVTVNKAEAKRTIALLSLVLGAIITIGLGLATYGAGSLALDTASMWLYLLTLVLAFLTGRALLVTVQRWRGLA